MNLFHIETKFHNYEILSHNVCPLQALATNLHYGLQYFDIQDMLSAILSSTNPSFKETTMSVRAYNISLQHSQ
jgi:hypothetical protein